MHSFLYFRRAGGSHISTLLYACNMQKKENKAIFLRISGEMAKKRRNMQPTAKRNGSMQGSSPRTPARIAAWTASQNYVLLFSQPCRQYSYTKHSAAAGKLTSGASRQQSFVSRHPFYRANLNLPLANNHPSGVSRPVHPAARLFIPASQLSFIQYTATAGRLHLPAANTLSALHLLFFLFFFFLLFFFSSHFSLFFSHFSGILLNIGSSSTGSSGL